MAHGRRVEMGRTAVLQVDGVQIILTERRIQPFDAEALRSVGIEPKECKFIALKSAVHFRADFDPFAHDIVEVDTPGIHSHNLFSFDYKRLRPIFPLNPDVSWP